MIIINKIKTQFKISFFNKKNQLHRINYPAYLKYFKDVFCFKYILRYKLAVKFYYNNNKFHNEFGPAEVTIIPEYGNIEYYWFNGKIINVNFLEDFLEYVQEQKELEYFL